MRIKKIKLKNYRQYSEQTVDFNIHGEYDLHLFIGDNGAGKTNIMNALTWCLFEQEPYLNLASQAYPILNLPSFEETNIGNSSETQVEVTFQSKQRQDFIFSRKAKTIKLSENTWKTEKTDFHVYSYDNRENMEEVSSDHDAYVARIFPPTMRDYYFFDGEQLFKYFDESSSKKVRDAIFTLSKVDVLADIADHLNYFRKKYEREIKQQNPELENLYNKKEELEKDLDGLKLDLQNKLEYRKQLIIKQKENEEYFRYNIPPEKFEEYKEKKEKIERDLKEKKKTYELWKNKRLNSIFYGSLRAFLFKAIENFISTIKEGKDKAMVPPPIKSDMVREILDGGVCKVCGRDLDEESRKNVNELYKRVNINSGIGDALLKFENSIVRHRDDAYKTTSELKDLNKEIKGFEDDIQKLEDDFKELDEILKKSNVKETEEKLKDKSEIKNDFDKLENEIQDIRVDIGTKDKELQDFSKNIVKEETKKKQHQIIYEKVKILENSSKYAKDIVQEMMDETRESVKNATKLNFERLLWKKMTYKDLFIDNDYMVHLLGSHDIECLGSAGAAERELLALAFTMALHSESGFDLPILIDTPVGRVTGINRENFAQFILSISREKQIILLLNPNEYLKELEEAFQEKVSNKFEMSMPDSEFLVDIRRE